MDGNQDLEAHLKTSKWMFYNYPLWGNMTTFCWFCSCLLLASFACLFWDLLKPSLVGEDWNKPFHFVFPTSRGSQSTALVMSIHIFLRRSLKLLYKTLLLTQSFPCAYHLQSSGKAERMNEIFTFIAQLSETLEFPWSKVLPLTLLTIRSTPLKVHHSLLISW